LKSESSDTVGKNVTFIREVTCPAQRMVKTVLVDLLFQNQPVKAVVDTASQITVVSEDFYSSIKDKSNFAGNIVLKGAGKNMMMTGKLLKDVNICMGGINYNWDVYVAPIHDKLILGLDFMSHHNVVIDL
jgi:hypothetical protein